MSNYKQKNYASSNNDTKSFSLKDKYERSSEQQSANKRQNSPESKERSKSPVQENYLPETHSIISEEKTGTKLIFIFLNRIINSNICLF